MQANPQYLRLDLTSPAAASTQIVRTLQGDSNSRPIYATILDNGVIRSDMNEGDVRLFIDTKPVPIYVIAGEIEAGMIAFDLPQIFTSGRFSASLRICNADSDAVLTAMPFTVEVFKSEYSDDAVMSENEGDVLAAFLRDTEAAKVAAETAAENTAFSEANAADYARLATDAKNVAIEAAENSATSADSSKASDERATASAEKAEEFAQSAAGAAASAQQAAASAQLASKDALTGEQNANSAASNAAERAAEATASAAAAHDAAETARFAAAEAESAANGTVHYDKNQVLTTEQQAQARENIGIEIVNELSNNNQIPNGAATTTIISEMMKRMSVSTETDQQLAGIQKQIARQNIDVDGGKWEKLHTFTGDGTTPIWEFSEYSNGAAIKLDAVAVRVINNAPSNGSATMRLYSYYRDVSVARVFLANALNTNTRTYATGLIFPFMGIYAPIGTSGSAYSGNVTWTQDQGFDLSKNTEVFPYIDKVKIDIQSDTIRIPNTTTVEIWGVKHYE